MTSWIPDQVRNDEEEKWRRVLAGYEAAAAEVRGFERATSGKPFEEMERLEERYGALGEAMEARLRRLLRAPATDAAALAVKLDLVAEHKVGTLSGGEACMAAIRRDAHRLAAARG